MLVTASACDPMTYGPTTPCKQDVLGVQISKTSYTEVVEICSEWAKRRNTAGSVFSHYICVTSVHGIITARADSELRSIINDADIATPDGMPVVWALRSFGHKTQERVYGPTLMLEICRRAAADHVPIFLYGGHDATMTDLKSRLCSMVPGLQIAGSYIPPFRALTEEEDRIAQDLVRASGAGIVFVGISTPKQEKWMYEHRSRFPGVTLVGVGAAFDFHAGTKRQAPPWMQRHGLEWLFRLLEEPRRLWRRYLLITPRFLPLWAMQLLRRSLNVSRMEPQP